MPPTRTDRISSVIQDELARRRVELDADHGIKRVTLTVVLDCKSGRPWSVVFIKEAGREVAR